METEVSLLHKLLNALAWLKANLKNVIIGTVVVLAVAGTVSYMLWHRSQREVWASEALSEVKAPTTIKDVAPPDLPESFLKVEKEYPGTKAAARAVLEASGAYFVQGNYAEALKQYERQLKEYPESAWRAEATLGVAASLSALGKTNEAITKYEEVRRNPNAAVADQAKLDLAQLYEAQGKNIEALKMYDELMKAYPSPYSGMGTEAGMHLEELTNRYPALATNLAPITPPMTSFMQTNRPRITNLSQLTNAAAISNLMRMTNRSAALSNQLMQRFTNNPTRNTELNTNVIPVKLPAVPGTNTAK